MKGKKQLIYNEKIKAETEAKMGAPVSRFQSVERGTQYRNSMTRETEAQTQGPPQEVFSGNIDRFVWKYQDWEIIQIGSLQRNYSRRLCQI